MAAFLSEMGPKQNVVSYLQTVRERSGDELGIYKQKGCTVFELCS